MCVCMCVRACVHQCFKECLPGTHVPVPVHVRMYAHVVDQDCLSLCHVTDKRARESKGLHELSGLFHETRLHNGGTCTYTYMCII